MYVCHDFWGLIDAIKPGIIQAHNCVAVTTPAFRGEICCGRQFWFRLNNFPEICLDLEARRILILHHVVGLTLKHCLVPEASSFPVLNIELLNAW